MEAKPGYKVIRHAPISGVEHLAFVAIARWEYDDKREWCLEYWERRGEAGADKCFPSEGEAMRQAEQEFGLKPDDWRDGPQSFAD